MVANLPISVVIILCPYPRCSKKGDEGLVLVTEGLEWKLPGGRQEPGETPEQCAIREVREETGIRLGPADLTKLKVMRQNGAYNVTYFGVVLDRFPRLRSKEDRRDSASANIFPVWTIRGGGLRIFSPHFEILRTYGLI